ncbi:MAG TPA: thermostable hemolysin [Albitalea sp.]
MALPSSSLWGRLVDAAPPPEPSLSVHRPGDAGRSDVERFVRQVYASRYGADLKSFAPVLVSLRQDGAVVAAAGFRPAAWGALFLERYLQQPVEALLAGDDGVAPARPLIVEVGHLASTHPGEGRRLIRLLAPHLAAQGFDWVVSTLTEELRRLFLRLGVTPLTLGVADPAALGADAACWGSYYDHRPAVLAGRLQSALRLMARRDRGSDAA